MNAFFRANGYRISDRENFTEANQSFATIWGVADELLFNEALDQLDRDSTSGQKRFLHIMTTSNHRPYVYPGGHIDIPSKTGRDGAVKYTDWAIGDFLTRAARRPWFKDTLFIIVADHNASVAGKQSLPPNKYRIPALLYWPAKLAPRRIEVMASQIDLPPTVLALLGIRTGGVFFGQDLLGPAPEPKRVIPSLILDYNTSLPAGQPDYDGLLVSLRGRLKSVGDSGREGRCLYLECDGVLVPVDLGTDSLKAFADLREDSELEVTGACVVSYSNLRPVMNFSKAVAFRLLLRAPEDLVVVRMASWWTARRLLWALGGAAGLLAIVLLWNMQLRRRVERRTSRLAVEMRARLTAESRIGERTRLAAELHDSLAQSLTGVALQLQAAEMARAQAPEEIEQHVSLARELLDSSREEIRRCVWDLRAQVLDQRDLPAALAEVGRQMGGGARVEVCTEGDVLPLSDMAAHTLLRCAQEAMTNAVNHGSAKEIHVLLRFAADHVDLRVEDNGCGFDPARVPGMSEGHFGLQGMRERVKRLEGEFAVASQPGGGTWVDIRIPAAAKGGGTLS
jgi:signal transduction histidine kinase